MHIFVSCLLPRDYKKSVNRSLLYAVNSCLEEFCTNEFHYIELDSGWTLNNHLNTELFRNDNLHLQKPMKLFISKIESLQITLRRQNSKALRNSSEAVSLLTINSLLYYQCIETLVNLYVLLMFVNPCPMLILPSKHICSFNFSEPIRSVNSTKSVCPVDALKPAHSVSFNKIACTVNSNKHGHPVNSSTLVRPVNSSNFVRSADVRTVNSNKPLHPVNSSRPVRPVDLRKSMRPVISNKLLILILKLNVL